MFSGRYLLIGNGTRAAFPPCFDVIGCNNFDGFKAKHWCHSFALDIKPRDFDVFELQLCPFPIATLGNFYGWSKIRHLNNAPIKFCPPETFAGLQKLISRPSTGMAMFWWLFTTGADFKIDGFDFFNGINNTHNGAAEKQLVQKCCMESARDIAIGQTRRLLTIQS